jgi:hypothetical protein
VGATNGTIVLSALEFDILWEVELLPLRHPALEVPSPGVTHTERAHLIEQAWASLQARGLAKGRKASSELIDLLNLFAHPEITVDVWIWTDLEIKGLAVSAGYQALLGVVDTGEVWLIPTRPGGLADAAVSVAGELAPGVGQSISVPHDILVEADTQARGEAKALVTALEDRDVPLWQAQELAGMLVGQEARGQFGVERAGRDGLMRRADRVVAFYDTDAGRYLFQLGRNTDGRDWATVTPAGSQLLAQRLRELLDEA